MVRQSGVVGLGLGIALGFPWGLRMEGLDPGVGLGLGIALGFPWGLCAEGLDPNKLSTSDGDGDDSGCFRVGNPFVV
jgi:hypothetical protein